jgi:DNA-binding GntR family transcriptional regulator
MLRLFTIVYLPFFLLFALSAWRIVFTVYTVHMVDMRERAYNHLRDQLERGDLASGARVSDFALAKTTGLSRQPIREAMGRLVSEGLLERVPHYGTFVRKLSVRELSKLYEFRQLLEGYAARIAADRVSQGDLAYLEETCNALHQFARDKRQASETYTGDEVKEWIRLDLSFHMRIVHACDNEWIAKSISDYRVMTNAFTAQWAPLAPNFLRVQAWVIRDHRRILAALKRGHSASAEYWMIQHIHDAHVRYLRLLEDDNSSGDYPTKSSQYKHDWERLVARMEHYQQS